VKNSNFPPGNLLEKGLKFIKKTDHSCIKRSIMELCSFSNEAVNVVGNILLIAELAWNVGMKAKGVTIVLEENGVAIILQFVTKYSSL